MREPMDAFNNPKVKRVIGMFSAQVAKTTIIENVVAYHACHDPSPIMAVFPTLEIAESFSKDRLAPMVRDTPALKGKFAEAGSKTSGDTLLHKKFSGGHITLAGANSFNSLASRPIRIVLGDEAAKWRANEKGSPFRQVSVRVRAFWNSKQGFFSTPTDTKNEFHKMWEESDQRLFEVPCPHCGEYVVFTFNEEPQYVPTMAEIPNRAVLKWTEGKPIRTDDGRMIRRADDAWFECLLCKGRIDDVDRHNAVKQGRWFPTAEFHGTAGYWGWQAMSPFAVDDGIANEWLGALGSPVEQQSVKNETLGLPWSEQGEAPDWKRLFDRAETYPLRTVPEGALFLTCGVDIQSDRWEAQVVGWGRNQAWLVDYRICEGDPARPEMWQHLDALLGEVYQNSAGADFTIKKLAIDSGYASQHVYEWARKHRFGVVQVVKGASKPQTAPVGTPSAVELSVSGKKVPAGIKIRIVDTDFFKRDLYSRLSLEAPNLERGEKYPDNYFHICATDDTEEYCRQITAEQRVRRLVKGYETYDWEKTRPRNEALDTWGYAAAAKWMLNPHWMRDQNWQVLEAEARAVPAESPKASAPIVPPTPRRVIRSSFMS